MRLMSWNINRFTNGTLHRGPNNLNMWYVTDTINRAEPDIFVLIEVQSGKSTMGSLITVGGKDGVFELLTILRNFNVPNQIDWMLVPPLKLVDSTIDQQYTEGIAVFYNNATLDFQGPYYWDNNKQIGVSVQTNTPYPGAWATMLPQGNNRAGKYKFADSDSQTLGFPAQANRPPFYTLFHERGGLQRNIKLFSVHFPPHRAPAAEAMFKLSTVAELGQLGANDVFVAAGDFNFDPRPQPKDTTTTSQYYGYAVNGLFGDQTYRLGQPFFVQGTRVQDTDDSSPFNYLLDECLDNIFARYGSLGIIPPNHNAAVINPVAGTPAPYITETEMQYSIGEILTMQTPIPTLDALYQVIAFRSPENYGHIARYQGVSDHLPVIAEI
ncbi:MAG: endonuclease/exonuclease/phosphatase family protein [Chloroflexia bacterium]